jgi:hypothetical protein
MGMFSPEFSAFWLGESEQAQPAGRRASEAQKSNDEGLSPSQQVALEELTERVNAARSVI